MLQPAKKQYSYLKVQDGFFFRKDDETPYRSVGGILDKIEVQSRETSSGKTVTFTNFYLEDKTDVVVIQLLRASIHERQLLNYFTSPLFSFDQPVKVKVVKTDDGYTKLFAKQGDGNEWLGGGMKFPKIIKTECDSIIAYDNKDYKAATDKVIADLNDAVIQNKNNQQKPEVALANVEPNEAEEYQIQGDPDDLPF